MPEKKVTQFDLVWEALERARILGRTPATVARLHGDQTVRNVNLLVSLAGMLLRGYVGREKVNGRWAYWPISAPVGRARTADAVRHMRRVGAVQRLVAWCVADVVKHGYPAKYPEAERLAHHIMYKVRWALLARLPKEKTDGTR